MSDSQPLRELFLSPIAIRIPPCGLRGLEIDPLRLLAGCHKRRLNQAPLDFCAWPHPNSDVGLG